MGWPTDPAERKRRKHAEYVKHRIEYLERNAAYKKTPAGKVADRNWRLKKRYYVNGATWDSMFKKQNGVCALCNERPVKHTDHCHVSGRLRELLCQKCNMGLGMFNDDPYLLMRAVKYLIKHNGTRNRQPQPKTMP